MPEASLKKILVVNVLVLAGLIGVVELAARAMVGANTTLNMNLGGFKIYHPTRGAALDPGYSAEGVSINSFGILGPEFDLERREGTLRVLCIGDSVTFHPTERDNYCGVLGRTLQSQYPDVQVETVVGAVPGYSSYEALDWYREFLHRVQPDIATIYIGWNDMGQFHPYGLRYKNEGKYRERSPLGWLMTYSYAARIPEFFAGRIERAKPIDLTPLTDDEWATVDQFYPQHYEDNLKTLIAELRRDEARVYLVSLTGLISYDMSDDALELMHFPRKLGRKLELYRAIYRKYEIALNSVSTETETPIVDLTANIEVEDLPDVFTDTVHITRQGARVYGAVLARELAPAVSELVVDITPGRTTRAAR